ncbi:kelch-like protein 17 [Nasonia vitripennis]|uniref:Kelch-like protein diablo n=1 Tax=Nasonia vitripennis TaxID=7425 RepID=A0A7M7IQH8_NASVI|nr:kelch-like protein 17 [Nasonia vitripennis]
MEDTLQKYLVYQSPNHFSSLERLWVEGKLCDITINANGKEIRAHRFILAATIPYFETVLLSNFAESDREMISVQGISQTNVELFIKYAYTGQITLTEENAQCVMIDSDYLGLSEVKNKCAKFLEYCLDLQNVFEIYNLAELLDCTELQEKATKFIVQHFHEVSKTEQYSNVTSTFLINILSNEDMYFYSQEKVFEAVLRWIKYDVDNRKINLQDLIALIRFSSLSDEYVVHNVMEDELISDSVQCRNFINNMRNTQKCCKQGNSPINMRNSNREFGAPEGHVVIFCTWNASSIEMYNPYTDNWDTSNTNEIPGKAFICTAHKNRLYIVAGYVKTIVASPAWVYKPQRRIWNSIAPMNISRCDAGLAALNGYLYVCGGRDKKPLNIVERYCPETNKWKIVSSMHNCRYSLSVVAFEGFIYALGGHDGNVVLDTVERYDPAKDQWTILDSRMNEERSNFGAAVLNGKLFVCGGSRIALPFSPLNSVEVYDSTINRWEYKTNMDTARFSPLVVVNVGKLWAIGGNSYARSRTTIEMYDPETNSWSYAPPLRKKYRQITGAMIPF